MSRNRHTLPLIVIGLVIGALTAVVIFAFDWFPLQSSEQAERLDPLMWFLVIASGLIYTIVATVLVYSVWRWRVREDDDRDGAPIHGNTLLEVVYTAIPAALLAAVGVYSLVVLDQNEARAENRIEIGVIAQQFAWSFQYPGAPGAPGVETGDLRVPVDRQVLLRMTANDVIHSFFVPEIRMKQDVVPGITTRVLFNPTRVGTYRLHCYELCGTGHAVMVGRLIVMPGGEYDAWLAQAQRQVAQPATTPPQPGQPSAPTPTTDPSPASSTTTEPQGTVPTDTAPTDTTP